MKINSRRLRSLHRFLAPVMMFPLLLTLVTGSLFQMAAVSGKGRDFIWLLELHKGHFGILNLEIVYPFLNALGLLTLVATGILMWWQIPPRRS